MSEADAAPFYTEGPNAYESERGARALCAPPGCLRTKQSPQLNEWLAA